jgi:hypothetical protein
MPQDYKTFTRVGNNPSYHGATAPSLNELFADDVTAQSIPATYTQVQPTYTPKYGGLNPTAPAYTSITQPSFEEDDVLAARYTPQVSPGINDWTAPPADFNPNAGIGTDPLADYTAEQGYAGTGFTGIPKLDLSPYADPEKQAVAPRVSSATPPAQQVKQAAASRPITTAVPHPQVNTAVALEREIERMTGLPSGNVLPGVHSNNTAMGAGHLATMAMNSLIPKPAGRMMDRAEQRRYNEFVKQNQARFKNGVGLMPAGMSRNIPGLGILGALFGGPLGAIAGKAIGSAVNSGGLLNNVLGGANRGIPGVNGQPSFTNSGGGYSGPSYTGGATGQGGQGYVTNARHIPGGSPLGNGDLHVVENSYGVVSRVDDSGKTYGGPGGSSGK